MTSTVHDGVELLEKLKKSFYKGSYNFILQPEDVNFMTWDWQQKFLDETLNSKLIQKYPVSRQFTRLFLKKVIANLEGKQEVHDGLYSYLCLAMNTNAKEDSFCYRHYLIHNNKQIITMKETNKMVINGTTGMRTWEAALMLTDWALLHKEVFVDKYILELGSGVGFTGITIGKICKPRYMLLSDCHPDVISAICDNIIINFPDSEFPEKVSNTTIFKNEGRIVGAFPLEWNSPEDLSDDIIPDVVIGADIVYDPLILQPLCDILKKLFNRNNQLEAYIASVIRNEETFQSFLQLLDKMNFTYQKLHLHESNFIEWDHKIDNCLLKINYASH